ncbi:MAG: phytanoyl-CoA dioxygenase family protein [candidate division Zixibacteria bacterium]|nr:phytanoyl-CoA dioxygenase family protein [candidate division Zixibacteria bacterium]
MTAIDPLEEYLFDLRGYTLLKNAVAPDTVRAINAWIDALPPLEIGQWHGHMVGHNYGGPDGFNIQNIFEGGDLFESFIDHPAWIDRVRHYIGPRQQPYVYEAFLNLRGPGGYIGIHSGGHNVDFHQRTGRSRGQWVCTMLSLILALNDVNEGDGATTLIPGSHKSDFPHPRQTPSGGLSPEAGDSVEEATLIYMRAGEVLLFNDGLAHGSTARINAGQRRMIILRYVPAIFAHRFGYEPSPELLARLTPERHQLLQPITPMRRSALMIP